LYFFTYLLNININIDIAILRQYRIDIVWRSKKGYRSITSKRYRLATQQSLWTRERGVGSLVAEWLDWWQHAGVCSVRTEFNGFCFAFVLLAHYSIKMYYYYVTHTLRFRKAWCRTFAINFINC